MACTVLIVDREPEQRDALAQSLHKLGYHTLARATLSESAQLFGPGDSSSPPDLILYDWTSAGEKDETDCFKGLCANAPVVALVKFGDYHAGLKAVKAGAQDFLTKPVATERLSTTFRNILQLRDVHRETEWLRKELAQGVPVASGLSAFPSFALLGKDGQVRRMADIEAEAIRFAMHFYHGRMTEVARRLGIGRSTLYRKLSGLEAKQEKAA